MNLQEIRALFEQIEPDYQVFKQQGVETLQFLNRMIEDGSDHADSAAYAIALLDCEEAASALVDLTHHSNRKVRIAVAAGLGERREPAISGALRELLRDGDPQVRKFAVRSVGRGDWPELRDAIDELTHSDPEDFVRIEARRIR